VERVVLNALKKWLPRLIFAPPATGSSSSSEKLTYFLARYRLVSLPFLAQATTPVTPTAGAKARRAVAITIPF